MKLLIEDRVSRSELATSWLLRAGIGLMFIFIGKSKFAAHSEWIKIFDQIGFGQWFRYFTGGLQILGGVLVLIPRTFAFGIVILACTMAAAAAAWIFFSWRAIQRLYSGCITAGADVRGR